MTRYATFGGLIICLLFTACRKNSDSSPVFDINIDDEFTVDLWEELDQDSRVFRLDVKTIEKKECENYIIDYTILKVNNQINLTISHLIPPDDCNAQSTYINSEISLGELTEGDYFIQINLREEIINKGKLLVFDDHYQLEMNTEHGIALLRDKLYRIPEQAIWGYVAYSDSRDEVLANELIDELAQISEDSQAEKGYYGYFSLENNDNLTLHLDIEPNYVDEFLFHFEGDQSTLTSLLEAYRRDYGNKLEIKLFTAAGEVL